MPPIQKSILSLVSRDTKQGILRLPNMKTKIVGMMTMRKFFLIALLAFVMPVGASAQQVPDPDVARDALSEQGNEPADAEGLPQSEAPAGESPAEPDASSPGAAADGPVINDSPTSPDIGQSQDQLQEQPEEPAQTGIFAESSQRRLSADDLATLNCDDLWVARNEIFHRNGYCFRSQRGQDYFDNTGCTSQSQDILSELEWDNVRLIQDAERTNRCG